MKTLLVNPPWRKDDRYGVRAGSRWPFTTKLQKGKKIPGYMPFPFFLAYSAALLEKNGFDVGLVDGVAEGHTTGEFFEKVKTFRPDLVLIETSTPSIYTDLEIAKDLKEQFEMQIAISGPHASVYSHEILENSTSVDYVLKGEYEYILLELVECLEEGKNLKKVKGLDYKTNTGKINENPSRPLIEDLDGLPWPARHLLPMENYNDFAALSPHNVSLWASRGCPFECIFCLWPKVMYGGSKYRTRDPADVAGEMKWISEEYDFAQGIYFDDDTFNIGKKRIFALCDEIEKRDIDLPWGIMARADTMNVEMLERMKNAGLAAVKYGIESGVQDIVNNANKGLDLDKVRKIHRKTKQLGIKTHLTFTFGLPGETKETIQKTVRFARDLDPDTVQFSITTPFPGTKYFEMAEEAGWLLTKDWSRYDGAVDTVIGTDELTAEDLQNALEEACTAWQRHVIIREIKNDKAGIIKKGLKNPLGCVKTLFRVYR